jgi:hypothetical protein
MSFSSTFLTAVKSVHFKGLKVLLAGWLLFVG